MGAVNDLYRHSLALLTDLYQLTMAYGYWKRGVADRQAGASQLSVNMSLHAPHLLLDVAGIAIATGGTDLAGQR